MPFHFQALQNIVSHHLTLSLTIGSLLCILLLEHLLPHRAEAVGTWLRRGNNLSLAVLNHFSPIVTTPLIGALMIQIVGLKIPPLVNLSTLDPALGFLASFFCLELWSYSTHRLFHAIPWLWRFHLVHHSDITVDATTSFRHHPIEIIINMLLSLPLMFLLRPDPVFVLMWSMTSNVIDVFNHGNLLLGKADRWLSYLVVTPGFHRVHHSIDRHFTDSNFSNNVPWFDYVFGTVRQWTPLQQAENPLGLGYFRDERNSCLDRLLIQPFMSRSKDSKMLE